MRTDRIKTELELGRISTTILQREVEPMLMNEPVDHMMQPPTQGPVTVGELSKLIRENPANMAQALKKWMIT